MADKDILTLPDAAAATGAEELHCVQTSNSRRISAQEIADLTDLELEEEGVLVGTFVRINFVGDSITITDAGGGEATVTLINPIDSFMVAASDEGTDLATGVGVLTFRMPYAITLTEVRANVNTAPTGSGITVDVNEGGVSIFSTALTIDDGEKTSVTAAIPAVISDPNLADDAELTIDIDAVGSTTPGKGLKITFIGRKT